MLEYVGKSKWLCKCECGNTKILPGYDVSHGRVKSCGCLAKETAHKLNLKKPGEAAFTGIYLGYKQGAKARGILFDLTREEVRNIINLPCHYCGAEKTNKKKNIFNNGDYLYNGIDRVNNNFGYELNNVVPCCFTCNEAKKTKSYEGFLEWIKRIYNYRLKEV